MITFLGFCKSGNGMRHGLVTSEFSGW